MINLRILQNLGIPSLIGGIWLSSAAVPQPPAVVGRTAKAKVTFNRDVAPIIYSKCLSCHRPDQGAPFKLETFSDVKKRGSLIAAVTKQQVMPPWKAAPGGFAFRDDRHLEPAQIETIQRWVSQGMSEGAKKDLPKMPEFPGGWTLGKPDLIVKMARGFQVPADGPDIYRNFVLPLHLPSNVFVSAIDFRPSARAVVHHSLFYYDATGTALKMDGKDGQIGFAGSMGIGQVANKAGAGEVLGFMDSGSPTKIARFGSLGGWAVGAQPSILPDGLAYAVPKDADLILSTHFHPDGKSEVDISEVGLYFAKTPPKEQFTSLLLPPVFGALNGIDIPAGAKAYVVKDSFTLPVDVRSFGIGGHAHYICKSMLMTAQLPDGNKKTLLSIPDWDFNWQDQYTFARDVPLPKGTKIDVVLTYDNTASNPRQPTSPPKRVMWGEQTTDEMGSIFLRVVPVKLSDLPALRSAYFGHIRSIYMARRKN